MNAPYCVGKFERTTPRTGGKEEAMQRRKEGYAKLKAPQHQWAELFGDSREEQWALMQREDLEEAQ